MRAGRMSVVVSVVAVVCLGVSAVRAQSSFDTPVFSDPNLLAAIFAPPPTKPSPLQVPVLTEERDGFLNSKKEFRSAYVKASIPTDWEAFDKQFAPEKHPGQPTLQLLENGFYEVNQTIYSVKLFERKVNSLLNFEYSLRELGGYDPRSKENALDTFFEHAAVKTDFNWDAPIGLYVGVKFQIKCNSIFQFWK